MFAGGVHCTRLYLMSMRPFSIGAICTYAAEVGGSVELDVMNTGAVQSKPHELHAYKHMKHQCYQAFSAITLLNVKACMSMWSASHSGHSSVIWTVTVSWFGSALQRPCVTTKRSN